MFLLSYATAKALAAAIITAEVPTEKIIAMMVGRTVEDLYPRLTARKAEVILKTDHLSGFAKPRSAWFSHAASR